MAKFLKLSGGIPTGADVTASINYYDESVPITTDIGTPGTGYNDAHTRFTLPNSETYDGTTNQLEVFCNEAQWEPGIHFNYQNSSSATYIDTIAAIPKDNRIRFRKTY
jgi:hypothetical protein